MKIRCKRPVITAEGITDIEYTFDTETLEFVFDPKDFDLLIDLYRKDGTQDIPEMTKFDLLE